jgi:hypothetical protein
MALKNLFVRSFTREQTSFPNLIFPDNSNNMKASLRISVLSFFVSFLSVSFKSVNACDCMPTSVERSLYSDHINTVFRGLVQRQQQIVPTNDTSAPSDLSYYVVNVGRIFKGCNLKNATNILVETPSDSSICGLTFDPKKTYLFSGNSVPAKSNIVEITAKKNPSIIKDVMVRVQACDLNSEFKYLSQTDKQTLWNSTNTCTTCTSAADCPGGIDSGLNYCDQGICVAYDRPCPPIPADFPWLNVASCMDDPCLTATPCVDGAKCIQNKCDKCGWPLWVNGEGNRVCYN